MMRLNSAIWLFLIGVVVFTYWFTPLNAVETYVTRSNIIDWNGALMWFNITFPSEWTVNNNYTITFSFRIITLRDNVALRLIKLSSSISGTEVYNATPILKELKANETYTTNLTLWAHDISFENIPDGDWGVYSLNIDLEGEVDTISDNIKYTYPQSTTLSFNLKIYSPPAPILIYHYTTLHPDINSPFNVSLYITNGGGYPIRNIIVKPDTSDSLKLLDVNVKRLDRLEPNQTATISFKILPIESGDSSIDFDLSYVSYGGYKITTQYSVNVIVKHLSTISCSINPENPQVYSIVNVNGSINPPYKSKIFLNITGPTGSNVMEVNTDDYGLYKVSFTPNAVGIWYIQAYWPGNEECSSTSTTLEFNVSKADLQLSLTYVPSTPTVGDNITITGLLSHPIDGSIFITIKSPKGYTLTSPLQVIGNGFTHTFTVNTAGSWTIEVKWPGNNFFKPLHRVRMFDVYPSIGEVKQALPIPITILIPIVIAILLIITGYIIIVKRRRKPEEEEEE